MVRAGLVAVPVNYRFPKKTIHFIIQDAGAKLVFCDRASRDNCPEDLPAVVFGEEGHDGFDRFVDPGEVETVDSAARGAGDVSLHLGLDRHAEGRRAFAPESHLGGGTRHGAGLDRHRYLVAAPLYHMNALALAKFACARTPPSCCCRNSRRMPISKRSSATAYLAHLSAADDRHDAGEKALLARTDLSCVEFIRMGLRR